MDQNVKQGTYFTIYFYLIRWFDFATFASKAPKRQEAVKMTALSPPIVLEIL